MTSAWYVQRRTGNSGWVDVTWSLGVGGVAAIAAAWPVGYDWPHWRQLMVAFLAGSWCLRLGAHIAGRTSAATDDPRYRNLMIQWGGDATRRMFLVPSVASRGGNNTCALDRGRCAQSESKPANTGSDRAGDPAGCHRRGSNRRLAAPSIQKRSCEPKSCLRCRSLAMVPPSELFL